MILPFALRCQISHLIEHILNKNAVAGGGIVYEHVCHRSHQLTVLNYGAAAQECGQ